MRKFKKVTKKTPIGRDVGKIVVASLEEANPALRCENPAIIGANVHVEGDWIHKFLWQAKEYHCDQREEERHLDDDMVVYRGFGCVWGVSTGVYEYELGECYSTWKLVAIECQPGEVWAKTLWHALCVTDIWNRSPMEEFYVLFTDCKENVAAWGFNRAGVCLLEVDEVAVVYRVNGLTCDFRCADGIETGREYGND